MKKRGISLVTLAIGVSIMIILISMISVSLTFSTGNAKKLTFAKEIYNIQNIVTEYIEKEGVLPSVSEAITVTPTDTTQFTGETFTNGNINLNVLELTEIDIKNTNYGNKTLGNTDAEKAKDVYAISEITGRVYYIAGFKSGEKTYYTLTDELKQMIEKEQNVTIGEKTITFTPSKIGWANEGVSVTVFVPDEFTSPSITISNANITYTSSSVNGGVNYIVNSSKIVENYTITVNYTKNGTSSSATYQTKIDTVLPVISKDTNIENTTTQVKGLNATDTESGIKYFKYVEGVIDNDSNIKEYMAAYGKNINGGNIKFANKRPYTLYAEDKAGNKAVMYIDKYGNLTNVKPVSIQIPSTPNEWIDTKIGLDTIQEFTQGDGSENNPYVIDTMEKLAYLAKKVNSGEDYLGKYFILYSEIGYFDFLGNEWIPIGNKDNKFEGNINGLNYTIYNINISGKYSYRGIFGNVGENAVISNFVIENSAIGQSDNYAGDFVGIIAGVNMGTITGCHVLSFGIYGANYIGGIAGYNAGTIENCVVENTYISGSDYIGGITGYNAGSANNSTVQLGTFNTTISALNISALIGFNKGESLNNYESDISIE